MLHQNLCKYISWDSSSEIQELLAYKHNHKLREIEKSLSAYYNLNKFVDYKDKDIVYLILGDGAIPVTAAVMAFRVKGKVMIVDPLLNLDRLKKWEQKFSVRNIYYVKDKPENVYIPFRFNLLVVIAVHGNVDLESFIEIQPRWNYIYSSPESNGQTIEDYQDKSISVLEEGIDDTFSPKGCTYRIYKNLKGPGERVMDWIMGRVRGQNE